MLNPDLVELVGEAVNAATETEAGEKVIDKISKLNPMKHENKRRLDHCSKPHQDSKAEVRSSIKGPAKENQSETKTRESRRRQKRQLPPESESSIRSPKTRSRQTGASRYGMKAVRTADKPLEQRREAFRAAKMRYNAPGSEALCFNEEKLHADVKRAVLQAQKRPQVTL